jgi:hypothetical protein
MQAVLIATPILALAACALQHHRRLEQAEDRLRSLDVSRRQLFKDMQTFSNRHPEVPNPIANAC